jgi:hypothetical protein
MNRRHFLGTIPLAVAGCSRPAAPPVPHRNARDAHLAMLAGYRVPATATRTTPKAPVDVVERFPELKPLVRVAVRLHPRFGDEPGVGESKLGGRFVWTTGEAWPQCPEHHAPMVAVLQLRAEDAPPQFPMRPKADLFQLFWSPRRTKAGPPYVAGVWRTSTGGDMQEISTEAADPALVPVPCRVFPERVAELPPPALMPKQMRDKVEAWTPPVPFATHLSAARGTKVGGWPRVPDAPKCLTCVHPMDYLLTVDSCEWTAADVVRWKPTEDRDEDGFRRAAGLDFGKPDAAVQVYVCRRCEKWPLRAAVVYPTA